jgi:RNA polymerase sigma-70 factor (ECF subfamily)
MDVLSEGERDVIVLVLWTGLSYEEAALALDVPLGTIRSRLSRGRTKLTTALAPVSVTSKEST